MPRDALYAMPLLRCHDAASASELFCATPLLSMLDFVEAFTPFHTTLTPDHRWLHNKQVRSGGAG